MALSLTISERLKGMISNSKQDWSVGSIVRVGFMNLRVVDVKGNSHGYPDKYILEGLKNTQRYEFVPHHGLSKIH